MASPDVEDGGAPAPDAAELAALANGRVVEVACWVHEASRPGVTPERAAALRAAITKEVEAQG